MIRAILVDDEPNALELLELYIGRIPFVDCVAAFRNPLQALEFLHQNPVDIIFLDINMPQLSGISFLETLEDRPHVVLTTAYAEYAVKSYDFAVDDYLLKPITFERFLKAVNRIKKLESQEKKPAQQEIFLLLKSGYQLLKVAVQDILYLQKDGNYMVYYTKAKKILVRENVTQALENLPNDFMQVHKSYLVPISRIEAMESGRVRVAGQWVPVGAAFREEVGRRMGV
ncbi:MAG: response regulator transcription factor [Lewinellaceae bacterium]|nr:response regulator transcription factor [Lewinellaceae bacterium]